jgi:hypothetical protein
MLHMCSTNTALSAILAIHVGGHATNASRTERRAATASLKPEPAEVAKAEICHALSTHR